MEEVEFIDLMTEWQKIALYSGGFLCIISSFVFAIVNLEFIDIFLRFFASKILKKDLSRNRERIDIFNFNSLKAGILTVLYAIGGFFLLSLL